MTAQSSDINHPESKRIQNFTFIGDFPYFIPEEEIEQEIDAQDIFAEPTFSDSPLTYTDPPAELYNNNELKGTPGNVDCPEDAATYNPAFLEGLELQEGERKSVIKEPVPNIYPYLLDNVGGFKRSCYRDINFQETGKPRVTEKANRTDQRAGIFKRIYKPRKNFKRLTF